MTSLALSCVIFALILGAIGFDTLLRRAPAEHHLSKDSQKAVWLGVGLIATIAALVLGLLIAAAKRAKAFCKVHCRNLRSFTAVSALAPEEDLGRTWTMSVNRQ